MAGNVTAMMHVLVDGAGGEIGGTIVTEHVRLRKLMENIVVVMRMSVKVVDVIVIHVGVEQGMDR